MAGAVLPDRPYPLPSGAQVDQNSEEAQLHALDQLGDGGIDLEQYLASEDEPETGPFREGTKPPGTGKQDFKLTQDQRDILGTELTRLLDEHDEAMEKRTQVEDEIWEIYDMRPATEQAGVQSTGARMRSELVRTIAGQAHARLAQNIMTVEPLVRVASVFGDEEDDEIAAQLAPATERFLHNYSMYEMGMGRKLPAAIHRLAVVGTAVLMPEWRIRQRGGKLEGQVYPHLIPNRHVKIWPPTSQDWQDGYLFAGHDSFLTFPEWRAIAAQLDLDDDTIDEVEADAKGRPLFDDKTERRMRGKDIDTAHLQEHVPGIQLTQLYCAMALPEDEDGETQYFQLFLYRPLRKALAAYENKDPDHQHPYFPIRYNMEDESAWGTGAGHELLYCSAADSAFRNIGLDGLMAGAYFLIVRRPDSVHDFLTDRPMPGQVVTSEEPDKDYIARPMGGEIPQLQEAVQDNNMRAFGVTGMPPVTQGLGDPVQKSGTGTGATVALIQQAGKKMGQIDYNIRMDLTAFYAYVLKMVSRYAPDGLFYHYVSKDDASRLQVLKYVPPRGSIADRLHLWAQAPSAASSKESRQQQWQQLWGYVTTFLGTWVPASVQYLQQSNPAAIPRLVESALTFQSYVAKQIVQDFDLPGVTTKLPELPPPIPEDQVVNQLQQQLQQAQGQIQQMVAQAQAMMGGGALPGQPGGMAPGGSQPGPGGPPPGASPGGPPPGPPHPPMPPQGAAPPQGPRPPQPPGGP